MRIDFNVNSRTNQNFKAVNQKYLNEAKKLFETRGNVTSIWLENLEYDVALFKDISKQDAIDTMNAVRKYVNKGSLESFETTLNYLKSL